MHNGNDSINSSLNVAMKQFVALSVALAFVALLAVARSQSSDAPVPTAGTVDPIPTLVGKLELEKYKATIKSLTLFGDRRQGTQRNRDALDWIEAQLKSYGCTNIERMQYQYTELAHDAPRPPRPLGIVSGGAGGPPGQGGSTLFGNRIKTGVNTDPMKQPDEQLRELNAEQTPEGTSPRENIYCTKIGTKRPEEM